VLTRPWLLVGAVLAVWGGSCVAAVVNPDLVALAALTTTVMTATLSLIGTDAYLRARKDHDDE
jgi:hypothetical protein